MKREADVLSQWEETLAQWRRMSSSEMDEAGEDADRFQMLFYQWMDTLRDWVATLDTPPIDVEEARRHPVFARLFQELPAPLEIPFEMELETVLAGIPRDVDSTEQS